MEHKVDVVITQVQQQQQQAEEMGHGPAQNPLGSTVTHSWSDYAFGDHSNWVNVFSAGVGTMDVYAHVNGARAAEPIYSKRIPLTPGPLVVVIKVASDQDPSDPSKYWPLSEPDQIETIAASYVPPTTKGDASVRLFNLSPTTAIAGLTTSLPGTGKLDCNLFSYSAERAWS